MNIVARIIGPPAGLMDFHFRYMDSYIADLDGHTGNMEGRHCNLDS